MTFVSYAQNLEDVMLWRALKHVEKGFYVDVGAWDPVQDSVTRAFYERGWRGINIEPVQAYYDRLCCDRPLDTNIRAAIGQSDGELTLYEIPESGLSTTNMETADMHRMAGLNVVERKVESKSLNTVLEEHISGPIHFLKVDVEGSEFDVLRGLDLSKWRPWILVVEATIPNSPETNFASWEPMVLSAGYVLAYFDGLNYFYVAHEHEALAESLKVPPNVFDKYASACLIQTKQLLEKYADDNNRIERILTEARANNDRIERILAGERVAIERDLC